MSDHRSFRKNKSVGGKKSPEDSVLDVIKMSMSTRTRPWARRHHRRRLKSDHLGHARPMVMLKVNILLIVKPSTADVESVFSASGHVVTKLRTRLSNELVNRIDFNEILLQQTVVNPLYY